MLVTARRIAFTNGRTLYVLDRQTGKQIAAVMQPRTSDPLFASPAAFANGIVFVTLRLPMRLGHSMSHDI